MLNWLESWRLEGGFFYWEDVSEFRSVFFFYREVLRVFFCYFKVIERGFKERLMFGVYSGLGFDLYLMNVRVVGLFK